MKESPTETTQTQPGATAPTTLLKIRELVEIPPRAMRGSFHNRQIARIVQAASHQLYVRGMTTEQSACHDPNCSLCQVRVPWKPGAEAKLLIARHSRGAIAAGLGHPAANVAVPQGAK